MINPKIVVIIPAFNEENSIPKVIRDVPAGLAAEVVVVNNNSNDATDINAGMLAPLCFMKSDLVMDTPV